jgi:hypothetical protein
MGFKPRGKPKAQANLIPSQGREQQMDSEGPAPTPQTWEAWVQRSRLPWTTAHLPVVFPTMPQTCTKCPGAGGQ